ncbi:MAG: hypothetical protein WBA05_02840 [Gordonia sp. (in: high G+C Gram-positive bacteria)]|uniref:hypothetical protein n=1 Tax=Gordonia TaxID=2053 RepID=UPI0032644CCE
MTSTLNFQADRAIDVTLGVPLDGRVRLEFGGGPSIWRVDGFDRLDDLWGTGAIAREPISQGVYRDIARLDPATDVLCVATTTPVSRLGGYVQSDMLFALSPVGDDAEDDAENEEHADPMPLWSGFEDLLMKASVHADDRGEILRVTGSDPDGPTITLGTMIADLQRLSVVSAAPAPTSGPLWPFPRVGEEDRTTVVGELSPGGRLEAALLATEALRTWGVRPREAAVSYVTPIEVMTASLHWAAANL